MMSRYKLKIILWYTGLLCGILILIFALLYTILGYKLRSEIDDELIDNIKRIDKLLLETKEPPHCDKRFYDDIVANPRRSFYDIREFSDIVNDNYILFVYCKDKLMYLSKIHKHRKAWIKQFDICKNKTRKIRLGDAPFSIAAIQKIGYTVYVGYELSTVVELQKRILQIFLIILPIGIGLSVLCGYFVTQRSLKMIKNITNTAGRITSKNLNERIPVPSQKDEFTQLILTLNSMIDRLEQSFTMVQQFSQDAAHEIRTPLTIIRGEIEELLKDENCPEDVSNALESILEEVQYLSSLSNKLLLINRLDTGKIEFYFTTVNLDKIIRETFEDALILSAEKQLAIELKKCESAQIQGNEELLVRLFWNLIDNAIKYTPAGGSVTISLERTKTNALIRVSDTGTGIPAEDIPKIFDRFYRVDKSRSRELGGSGLGLAICKWIVDLHHGEIQVESEVNKGSTFTVTFPLSSNTE